MKTKIKAKIVGKKIDGEIVKIQARQASLSEFKIIDEEKGIFEAYASVFGNVDSYGEIVDKGAFAEWLGEYFPRYPKCVWAHDWTQPIAKTLECREDERGLYVKGQFVLEVQRAAEVYALMKAGVITDFSFGFRVMEDSWDEVAGVRHLKKIAIYEWSPVLVGANSEAMLLGVKADGEETALPEETPAAEEVPAADVPAEETPAEVPATDPEKPAEETPAADPAPETPAETPAPESEGGDAPASEEGDSETGKGISAEKRSEAIESVLDATRALTTALEALKAIEDAAPGKAAETSPVEGVDGKGSDVPMKVVRAILRDARKADKMVESIILRAKILKQ